MFVITYHYQSETETRTSTFSSVEDFSKQQRAEVPALDDDLIVDEVKLDGKVVAFNGTILDLYNKYN